MNRQAGSSSSVLFAALGAMALLLFTAPAVTAHQVYNDRLEVVVNADKITVRVHLTTDEVFVTNSVTGGRQLPPGLADPNETFQRHAEYVASHLHFTADGAALAGRVAGITPPADISDLKSMPVTYDLEYPMASKPRVIEIRQDVLADAHLAPGTSMATEYDVYIAEAGRPQSQLTLTRSQPVNFVPGNPGPTGKWNLFKLYFVRGVQHILGPARTIEQTFHVATDAEHPAEVGWDHLLFVSALVLSTKSLWDLLKVVSAFTLAHTITLTLAALQIVNVSTRISEPLISLSIVFVAVQNVFWPEQSRGWIRLGAAFFFGLFHGLGFAGGLLETMKEMPGVTVTIAILAFSIGVEIGHQIVVLPLFACLKLARATRATDLARERLSFNVQRFGSAAISLAGLFYLVNALRMSFGAS